MLLAYFQRRAEDVPRSEHGRRDIGELLASPFASERQRERAAGERRELARELEVELVHRPPRVAHLADDLR